MYSGDIMANSSTTTRLSEGSVVGQLIRFAIPLLLSNLIQSVYNVADMLIVGRFCGTASISGVNIGGQLTFFMTNAIFGLCIGGSIIIGQYFGARQDGKVKSTIATLLTFLIYCAVFFTCLMLIFAKTFLTWLNTPVESYGEALRYLRVTACGTIFIFGYNAFSCILRGMGNSRQPMKYVMISCITNIILDVIFVGPLGLAAQGAAIATVTAQALSMILCIIYFIRNDFAFDFKLKSFRIHKEDLRELLRVGIPTMIQNMISSISFMFLTGMVNTYGVAASAAVSVVNKLNSFAIMPPIAISNSVSSIAAQCFGAGDVHRAKKTFGIGLLLGWVLALPAFFLFKAIPVQLISLFDSDPEMIAAGLRYLTINLYDYLIVSFLFSTNGFINATGHTMFTAFNNILCSVIIRIPVAYVFGTVMGYGLMGVGAGTPCSTLIGTVIALAYYFIGSWKKGMIVQNQGEVDSGISEVGDPPVIE